MQPQNLILILLGLLSCSSLLLLIWVLSFAWFPSSIRSALALLAIKQKKEGMINISGLDDFEKRSLITKARLMGLSVKTNHTKESYRFGSLVVIIEKEFLVLKKEQSSLNRKEATILPFKK